VKDQYFGDVNDFRKYGLLRSLAGSQRFRLGVCWMLTPPDSRTQGSALDYLCNPKEFRHRDPYLFEWLTKVVCVEKDRRTARIEASGLLGSASFHSRILTDSPEEQDSYFSECAARLAGCDLVFFDPDNGLEVKSAPRGRKNSCKYLYWDEVCSTFAAGASVLIYQHFPREERVGYIYRRADELRQQTRAAAVFSFRTPYVLFLLASQDGHAATFRGQLAAIGTSWAPNQIVPAEHPAPDNPP